MRWRRRACPWWRWTSPRAERRDGAGDGRSGACVRDGHLPPAQAGAVFGAGAGLCRRDHCGGHRPQRAGGRGAGRRGRHARAGTGRAVSAAPRENRAQGQLWPRGALGREPGHGRGRGHRRDGGPARGRGAGNGGLPDDVVDVVQTLCPCATCAPLPAEDEDAAWESLSAALERADALGAGCGLGRGPMAAALMERLLRFLHGRALPCVLDADALNLLARRPAWLADGAAIVLTPHPGEAARLLGVSTAEILADMPGAAARIRRRVRRGGGAQGRAQRAVRAGGPGPQPLRHARHGQGRQRRRAHRRDGGASGRARGGRIRDGRPGADAGGVRPARAGGRAGRAALRRAGHAGHRPVRMPGLRFLGGGEGGHTALRRPLAAGADRACDGGSAAAGRATRRAACTNCPAAM